MRAAVRFFPFPTMTMTRYHVSTLDAVPNRGSDENVAAIEVLPPDVRDR
jgi:hypothetical protein